MRSFIPQNSCRCIVLTGTIVPNTENVARNDTQERKKEYLKALDFYIKNTSEKIFFLENSSYDIFNDEDFMQISTNPRISIIKYPINKEELKFGKGYLEFKMLDEFIKGYDFEEYVKISGRYIVNNIKKVIPQKNNGLVMDVHNKRKIGITSFFKVKRSFYLKYLEGCFSKADDSKNRFIEHVVFEQLKNVSNKLIDPFVTTPWYEGVSGSHGGSLNRHPLKTKIRNVERRLMKVFRLKRFIIEY